MDPMETTSTTAPEPTDPLPSSSLPTTTDVAPSPSTNPNPNPNPNPNENAEPSQPVQQHHQQPQPQQQQQQQQSTIQQSQIRPSGSFNRPRPQSAYPHFSPQLPSSSSSSSSCSPPSTYTSSPSLSSSPASSSISTLPLQRGGVAMGVPALHARPPQQPTSFSSFGPPSFNPHFGGFGRNSPNLTDQSTTSNTSQVRQPIQGIQSMGMMGSLGSSSQMRPGGIPVHHQQRLVQPPPRSQSPSNNQALASQKFQGHDLLRVPPGSPSPGTPQSLQAHSQPWMSAGSQGKQMHSPLTSPSYRPQMKSQSLQQRSHIPQQHHPLPTISQQQQQLPQSHQLQDHYGQQYPPPRVPQPVAHQQQVTKGQGLGNQKSSSLAIMQPSTVHSGLPNTAASADADARILSKRTIHELVSQIDPSEKLDPEVEDILMEIADEFVESTTTFACSLAKHRKSTILEAKDILLHLERNWNMTLPGFGGDEIKTYKKPLANDIHKERLAAIKKSIVVADAGNTKGSVGQVSGNMKGHSGKAPAMGLPENT